MSERTNKIASAVAAGVFSVASLFPADFAEAQQSQQQQQNSILRADCKSINNLSVMYAVDGVDGARIEPGRDSIWAVNHFARAAFTSKKNVLIYVTDETRETLQVRGLRYLAEHSNCNEFSVKDGQNIEVVMQVPPGRVNGEFEKSSITGESFNRSVILIMAKNAKTLQDVSIYRHTEEKDENGKPRVVVVRTANQVPQLLSFAHAEWGLKVVDEAIAERDRRRAQQAAPNSNQTPAAPREGQAAPNNPGASARPQGGSANTGLSQKMSFRPEDSYTGTGRAGSAGESSGGGAGDQSSASGGEVQPPSVSL